MRLFECQACGRPHHFESSLCESCGARLGFIPQRRTMSALEPHGAHFHSTVDPSTKYVDCANLGAGSCNWLVPVESGERFCLACRHNRTIPDLSDERNVVLWRRIEIAKRRLFYGLLRLDLPLQTKTEAQTGLAFDFLAPTDKPVMTGHLDGVVTINLAEADHAEREKQRGAMDEPYRTLLGHFRHEIAHYYWDRLVRDRGDIDAFRSIFGDERADYTAALKRHHADGPPADWQTNFVSAYATCHPWEDFAETWAHYLHIIDTLETARAFGVRTHPLAANRALDASVDFNPYAAGVDQLFFAWLPLTFAFNSINRSMGLGDLYPFALGAPVMVKLNYIHKLIHHRDRSDQQNDKAALLAVAASLKRGLTPSRVSIPRNSSDGFASLTISA
jgi:hypothetical protein